MQSLSNCHTYVYKKQITSDKFIQRIIVAFCEATCKVKLHLNLVIDKQINMWMQLCDIK